jgi:predicted secreted hydrolase
MIKIILLLVVLLASSWQLHALTQILYTNHLRKPGSQMDTALSSKSSSGSRDSYNPHQTSSRALTYQPSQPPRHDQHEISELTHDGYSIPHEGYHFTFPRDYGSHNDFKIEWWYITGHLFTKEGERFGFESTFFRSAAKPSSLKNHEKQNKLEDSTIFLADMALLDVTKKNFSFQRRLNRPGWDASASSEKLDLQNGNWSLAMENTERGIMNLIGSIHGDIVFQLHLTPAKPLVFFGKNAISRKGEDPSAVSYYMSFPRLQVEGMLQIGEQVKHVSGVAWMDHEISSSQLSGNQVGWDWCSLQLKDGREIMAYRMRLKDGSQDPLSTLTWIDPQGKLTEYDGKDFRIESRGTWKSPITHNLYPIPVRVMTIDPANNKSISFTLVPLLENQELVGNRGLSYWEGACRVLDEKKVEVGSAFLELTGYDAQFQKNLR